MSTSTSHVPVLEAVLFAIIKERALRKAIQRCTSIFKLSQLIYFGNIRAALRYEPPRGRSVNSASRSHTAT